MPNYEFVSVDEANPDTHVIIDIPGRQRKNEQGVMAPIRLSVALGTEEDTACDVLGLPKPDPAPAPETPVTPEDAAADD